MRSVRMDVGVTIAASVAMLVATIVGAQLLTTATTPTSSDVAPSAPRSCIERPLASPTGPGWVGIARLIARGLTNRQIADALVISERTASSHVYRLLGKLGFSSRAQAAAWAVRHGLGETDA